LRPLRAGRPWVRPVALACLLLTGGLNAAEDAADVGAVPRSEFVGSQACAECHADVYQAWRGSHHDLAMAEPTEDTVLGHFDDAELTAHGITSRFFRRDGGWFVNTDGPDGELHDYPIAYTFGWYPLQQYLIAFPGGRLQALGLAWDSRPASEGGQRWFHLYPDEAEMGPSNPLHWTAPDQTWNYQCAECHSTGLDKGYELSNNIYRTTWAEIDVACEACHGPASEHIAQAEAVAAGNTDAWSDDKGLPIRLGEPEDVHWPIDAETGLPRRSTPRISHAETELCARCHSRRGQIHGWEPPGKPLGDSHQLALLEPGLYHPDGQILDEVFVHGSFLQSRMYAAGVTCSDCHEPHSLALKRDGDEVCAQCHPVARYATTAHHHHPADSTGSTCIGCHMAQRNYMVIDARADHSMRVPRPDLSLQLGTPNACNACHADQDAEWAVAAMSEWYGPEWSKRPHYGEAIAAGQSGAVDAPARLLALAADADQPGIARATAIELLTQRLEPGHLQQLPALLADADPLVRRAAVGWLDAVDAPLRYRYGMPLLEDPDRSVRLAAARALAPLSRYELPDSERATLTAALEAYVGAQGVNADRPESHLNIGLVEMAQGKVVKARKAYQQALTLDPAFVPAYANLADLYRALGSDTEAEETLRAGLERAPDSAALHHALGLLQVRQKQPLQAIESLRKATELAPDDARYAYVYALALNGQGKPEEALAVLRAANAKSPADRDILIALVTTNRDAGNADAAADFTRRLQQYWPQDPQSLALARELGLD
jgi:predicted CXXCH cytochrome family protein